MAEKPLTQSEFSRKGAEATNTKYPKEVRSAWAKKGVQALKDKYGDDYHSRMAKERGLAKKGQDALAKKRKKSPIKRLLGIN